MNKKWLFSLWIACGLAQAAPYPIPDGMSLIKASQGDLDDDGIAELAIAYNHNKSSVSPRTLIIFKKDDQDNWQEMSRSDEALPDSRVKDSLFEIAIEDGDLMVANKEHHGKVRLTRRDTYHYLDDDFYLTEYYSSEFSPSEFSTCNNYFREVNYVLATREIISIKEKQDCDSDGEITREATSRETFKVENPKITLKHRRENKTVFKTPEYGDEIPLSP